MTTITRLICAIFISNILVGCANQQSNTSTNIPSPGANNPPPDIFNILVDGKTYNHMDDARRAMNEQEAKILDRISSIDSPRFGTLLVVVPPVHVPALNVATATPDYRERFTNFMAFLDSHNYEMNVAAIRKSNNFAKVVLIRSATTEALPESDADFKIWYQREGTKPSWWIKGRSSKDDARLAGSLDQGSLENALTLVAEVAAHAEKMRIGY